MFTTNKYDGILPFAYFVVVVLFLYGFFCIGHDTKSVFFGFGNMLMDNANKYMQKIRYSWKKKNKEKKRLHHQYHAATEAHLIEFVHIKK